MHNASELEDSDDDENLLVCNALHDSELVPATDQDIRDSVHRLASGDAALREQLYNPGPTGVGGRVGSTIGHNET